MLFSLHFFYFSFNVSPFFYLLTRVSHSILPYHAHHPYSHHLYLPSLLTSPSPSSICTHLSLYVHSSTLPSNTYLLASLSSARASSLHTLSSFLSSLAASRPPSLTRPVIAAGGKQITSHTITGPEERTTKSGGRKRSVNIN